MSQIFRTPRNAFGLWRKYSSEAAPTHDPEEHVTLEDKVDYNEPDVEADVDFSPYPNENSYLLGDWYWNQSAQKSKESFRELTSIVGRSDFQPADVANTPWENVNAKLGVNNFDGHDYEWMDEDAGWHKTPINISVPFHSRTDERGVENFYMGDFYHRSLVEVLKEKLSNSEHHERFHYKPFELWWTRPSSSAATRVHGELYTSPVFLDAYREVQEAPNEPGCNLEKVVVGMMFASDETLLATFGDAKLWPGYLSFGNDTKYCRCRPSSNCCAHVAYFKAVSSVKSLYVHTGLVTKELDSFLTLSKTSLPSVLENHALAERS